MRILPCGTCDTGRASLDAEGRKPYVIARFPRTGMPFAVRCRKCRRVTPVTVEEFNRIPHLTPAELEAHGLLDVVAKDLRLGHALTIEQARDMARVGFSLREVHALPPPPPIDTNVEGSTVRPMDGTPE